MKILIACEESQTVCTAFRMLGHDAWSCDIVPCSGGHPEWHLQCDVLSVLNEDWDMIIAFPPCTDLCASGSKHFKDKRLNDRQKKGVKFFLSFVYCSCPHICIENPIGIMSSLYRKPDQIVQPYQYGDPFTKSTCLWLKNIPLLRPTAVVSKGATTDYGSGKKIANWYGNLSKKNRALNRSKTFPGIAAAMASQWGGTKDIVIRNNLRIPYSVNFVEQKGLVL